MAEDDVGDFVDNGSLNLLLVLLKEFIRENDDVFVLKILTVQSICPGIVEGGEKPDIFGDELSYVVWKHQKRFANYSLCVFISD